MVNCFSWVKVFAGLMLLAQPLTAEVDSVRPVDVQSDSAERREKSIAALRDLRKELEDAGRAWLKEMREVTSDEDREALRNASPHRQFEQRFLELARTFPQESVSMEAVEWLAENANPGPAMDGGLLLAEQQLEHPGIAELCRTLVFRQSPGIERFRLAVADQHPSREVRGLACLCLARHLKQLRGVSRYLQANETEWLDRVKSNYSEEIIAWWQGLDPAVLTDQIDGVCSRITADYGDVEDAGYADTTGRHRTLADAAKALSFSIHAIGSRVPEAGGNGIDGSPVRLSDYRGQVVVLMFSANWCGPCKALYGQLRELMTLYADKPFSVVTIMADDRISTVEKAVHSGEMTWPVIWDGADGPIASAWDVSGYPTIYLIDPDGFIRSEGLRDDPLDDEVARMLGIRPEDRVRVDKRTRVWQLSLRDRKLSGEELPELLEGYTELRKLDLSHNPLTDESLIHLEKLSKLETVNLEHTGITDAGLQKLRRLSNLKSLHLYLGPGHRTTRDGRQQLRKAIPGLKILIITH